MMKQLALETASLTEPCSCGSEEFMVVTARMKNRDHTTMDTPEYSGDSIGDLYAECTECTTIHWTTPEFALPTPSENDWEFGSPCTCCGANKLLEAIVDAEYRLTGGEISDYGDQITTLVYECTECRTILAIDDDYTLPETEPAQPNENNRTIDSYNN